MKQEVIDPVCKMKIDASLATEKVVYQGKTYFLCSEPCADQFQANPGKFINAAEE